jgi:hypothetical protein
LSLDERRENDKQLKILESKRSLPGFCQNFNWFTIPQMTLFEAENAVLLESFKPQNSQVQFEQILLKKIKKFGKEDIVTPTGSDQSGQFFARFKLKIDKNILNIKQRLQSVGEFETKIEIAKFLGVFTKISAKNMHLLDQNQKIKKYDSIAAILYDYYHITLEFQQKKKDFEISNLKEKLLFEKTKLKFLTVIIEGKIQFQKQNEEEIVQILLQHEIAAEFHSKLFEIAIKHFKKKNIVLVEKHIREIEEKLGYWEQNSSQQIWLDRLTRIEDKIKNFSKNKFTQ